MNERIKIEELLQSVSSFRSDLVSLRDEMFDINADFDNEQRNHQNAIDSRLVNEPANFNNFTREAQEDYYAARALEEQEQRERDNAVEADIASRREEALAPLRTRTGEVLASANNTLNDLVKMVDYYRKRLEFVNDEVEKARENRYTSNNTITHDDYRQMLREQRDLDRFVSLYDGFAVLYSNVEGAWMRDNNLDVVDEFSETFDELNKAADAIAESDKKTNTIIVDVVDNNGKKIVNIRCGNIVANPSPEFDESELTVDKINKTIDDFVDAVARRTPRSVDEIQRRNVEIKNNGVSMGEVPYKEVAANITINTVEQTNTQNVESVDQTAQNTQNENLGNTENQTTPENVVTNDAQENVVTTSVNQMTPAEIRAEMGRILDIVPFEGIENTYEHAIEYQLDDWEKDRFAELRDQLKIVKDDERLNRIDAIRREMGEILNIPPYNGIENVYEHAIEYQLDDWEKDRFAELRDELGKLLGKDITPDMSQSNNQGLDNNNNNNNNNNGAGNNGGTTGEGESSDNNGEASNDGETDEEDLADEEEQQLGGNGSDGTDENAGQGTAEEENQEQEETREHDEEEHEQEEEQEEAQNYSGEEQDKTDRIIEGRIRSARKPARNLALAGAGALLGIAAAELFAIPLALTGAASIGVAALSGVAVTSVIKRATPYIRRACTDFKLKRIAKKFGLKFVRDKEADLVEFRTLDGKPLVRNINGNRARNLASVDRENTELDNIKEQLKETLDKTFNKHRGDREGSLVRNSWDMPDVTIDNLKAAYINSYGLSGSPYNLGINDWILNHFEDEEELEQVGNIEEQEQEREHVVNNVQGLTPEELARVMEQGAQENQEAPQNTNQGGNQTSAQTEEPAQISGPADLEEATIRARRQECIDRLTNFEGAQEEFDSALREAISNQIITPEDVNQIMGARTQRMAQTNTQEQPVQTEEGQATQSDEGTQAFEEGVANLNDGEAEALGEDAPDTDEDLEREVRAAVRAYGDLTEDRKNVIDVLMELSNTDYQEQRIVAGLTPDELQLVDILRNGKARNIDFRANTQERGLI